MERLPITVAHRPLPVAIDIVHCYCPSAIAHLPLPVWCCPSAVARRPLPIGRCPFGHRPFAITHRPLPITLHCCRLSITVVFCQKKFFMEMKQWGKFFLLSFVRIFSWRWDSETFFSFCLLSTWRRERGDGTVWQFYFCLFFITSKLSLLSKKIITLFQ